MADLTVFAESLISTVARAFYDDEMVCLIDVLLRERYLRDDDMALRLQLPVKKLRASLQFLSNEHIVREENVDDLHEGGSQATRFFYIDYNRAVHSMRLRLHLLQRQLEAAELQARSSSFYLCPGYNQKRCNGRYTEEEAQRVLDVPTGLFICQECSRMFQNDPHAPPLSEYTLQLVDNEKDLRLAMDRVRRFRTQLSAKSIGNVQLRPGIFDLLQKVRGGNKGNSGGAGAGGSSSMMKSNSMTVTAGRGSGGSSANIKPITSNLPSENFALGIGSKRLAGTGRTAGIKAIKMQKKGLAESSAEARKYLVGSGTNGAGGTNGDAAHDRLRLAATASGTGAMGAGGNAPITASEVLFLKSAHGHEIQFSVEKGGGARAQVLANGAAGAVPPNHANSKKRALWHRARRRKLMDMAASRIGVALPIPIRVQEALKRKAEREAALLAEKRRRTQQQQEEQQNQQQANKNNDKSNGNYINSIAAASSSVPEFLLDNIGRGAATAPTAVVHNKWFSSGHEGDDERQGNQDDEDIENCPPIPPPTELVVLDDEIEEMRKVPEENRLAAFQMQYKIEMERQEQMLLGVKMTGGGAWETGNLTNGTTDVNSNHDNNNGILHGINKNSNFMNHTRQNNVVDAGMVSAMGVIDEEEEEWNQLQWED